ncbi:hypothetical protein Tco_0702916 [Tanacetum coccineum]|uniref:Uncharacterized protein n=1 Tax=Tanacetum coccineum TaxID=301880 RepID=A0ABQ4XZ36_9ASTR
MVATYILVAVSSGPAFPFLSFVPSRLSSGHPFLPTSYFCLLNRTVACPTRLSLRLLSILLYLSTPCSRTLAFLSNQLVSNAYSILELVGIRSNHIPLECCPVIAHCCSVHVALLHLILQLDNYDIVPQSPSSQNSGSIDNASVPEKNYVACTSRGLEGALSSPGMKRLQSSTKIPFLFPFPFPPFPLFPPFPFPPFSPSSSSPVSHYGVQGSGGFTEPPIFSYSASNQSSKSSRVRTLRIGC